MYVEKSPDEIACDQNVNKAATEYAFITSGSMELRIELMSAFIHGRQYAETYIKDLHGVIDKATEEIKALRAQISDLKLRYEDGCL